LTHCGLELRFGIRSAVTTEYSAQSELSRLRRKVPALPTEVEPRDDELVRGAAALADSLVQRAD
jgi:hypothetical protein